MVEAQIERGSAGTEVARIAFNGMAKLFMALGIAWMTAVSSSLIYLMVENARINAEVVGNTTDRYRGADAQRDLALRDSRLDDLRGDLGGVARDVEDLEDRVLNLERIQTYREELSR